MYLKMELQHSIYQKKIKIDNSTIIVRDFTIPLSIEGKRTRQKVNKERKDFNNTISKLELTEKKK